MNRLIALAGATMLATAGVAIAQDMPASQGTPDSSATSSTAPDTATTTSQPTTAASPATGSDQSATAPAATPDQSAAMPQPSTTQTASATAAPAANPSVVAEVQSKWATYDTQNKGKLTPLEFGEWVMAAKGNDVSKSVERTKASKASNLAATKVLNATGSAFAKADTNKDGGISPDELAAFLSA